MDFGFQPDGVLSKGRHRVVNLLTLGLVCATGFLSAGNDRHWHLENDLEYESDPLYQRHHALASTAWEFTKKHADIAYFVFAAPAKIERYNLVSETWLPMVVLSEAPTAFHVDEDGLYIAFGRRASHFELDGTNESLLRNTPFDISAIFTWGNFVYLNYSDIFLSLDKQTGSLIDSQDFFYSLRGMSVGDTIGKAFGRSTNTSPSDIVEIVLNPDGTLGGQNDSPYHGDFPSAVKTWMLPTDTGVVDNAGIVYHTGDLTYLNSLGGGFDHLDFYGDQPVVLRDQTFTVYSQSFLETGSLTVEYLPEAFYIQGEKIHAFYEGGGSLLGTTIPIENLTPSEPGEPVDPNGLAYDPDTILVDETGIIYLLSRDFLSIFRWSVSQRRYLETIPLVSAPDHMAYSADNRELYLTYPGGPIKKINLDSDFGETPFVNSPQTPLGLATAGPYVFVCDPSGAWVSHFTYHPDGSLISQEEWNYFSREYVWSETNRKMYHFRDSSSPNDLIWEDIDVNGVIGQQMDSPYHGDFNIRHPIRLTFDDSRVLIGSGVFFDAVTLVFADALPNNIDGAAPLADALVTTRSMGADTEVQIWAPNLGLTDAFLLDGTHLTLLKIPTTLSAVTMVDGIPWFWKLSPCVINGGDPLAEVPGWPHVSILVLTNTINECTP